MEVFAFLPRDRCCRWREKPFFSLFCGMVLMTCAGTQYMFGAYSPDLKLLMGYNQPQISLVGSMLNLGMYLGVLPGFFYDRFGCQWTSVAAAAMLFVGWFGVWLSSVFLRNDPAISVWLVGSAMFIQGHGSTSLYTAALASNVPKFSIKHKGKIVGLLAACFGLSGAIFTQIYDKLLDGQVELFLHFMYVSLPVLALVFGAFLLLPPHMVMELQEGLDAAAAARETASLRSSGAATGGRRGGGSGRTEGAGALGGQPSLYYESIPSFDSSDGDSEDPAEDSRKGRRSSSFTTTGSILGGGRRRGEEEEDFLDDRYGGGGSNNGSSNRSSDGSDSGSSNSNSNSGRDDGGERQGEKDSGQIVGRELTAWEMMKTEDCWLVYVVFMLGTGVGLTNINHLGSLVLSLGGENGSQTPLITLLSICNSTGRLVSGILTDLLQRRVSRASVLLVDMALFALVQLYLAMATEVAWLYPAVVALGAAYGTLMAVTPALVNELFGALRFGSNWAIVRTAPAISGVLLSTVVAGYIYESHVQEPYSWEDVFDDEASASIVFGASSQAEGDNPHNCYGQDCYLWAWLINFCVCVLAAALASRLVFVYRRVFKASKIL